MKAHQRNVAQSQEIIIQKLKHLHAEQVIRTDADPEIKANALSALRDGVSSTL